MGFRSEPLHLRLLYGLLAGDIYQVVPSVIGLSILRGKMKIPVGECPWSLDEVMMFFLLMRDVVFNATSRPKLAPTILKS
jgi:hypothetical protein